MAAPTHESLTMVAPAVPRATSAFSDLVRTEPNLWLILLGLASLVLAAVVGATGATVGPAFKFLSEAWLLTLGMVGALFTLLFLFAAAPRSQWVGVVLALVVGVAAQPWLQTDSIVRLTDGWARVVAPFAFSGVWVAGSTWMLYRRAHAAGGIPHPDALRLAALLGAMIFILMFTASGDILLAITQVLHPATQDAIAWAVDKQYGISASAVFAGILSMSPEAHWAVRAAYALVPFGFPLLFGLQLRSNRPQAWNFVWTWAALTMAGFVAYQLYPISGPRYWLGAEFYLKAAAADANLPIQEIIVSPAPRNGMPSLHFGWAYAMWMMSFWAARRWVVWVFGGYAALMVLATLGLGEHYLIDIVVAVPFVGAVLAATMRPLAGQSSTRRAMFFAGAGLYAAWILALRFAPSVMSGSAGPVWTLTIASLAYGVWQFRRLTALRTVVQRDLVLPAAGPDSAVWTLCRPMDRSASTAGIRSMTPILAMFVLSGMAGLMYEVLFSKQLALVFGSSAQASYTVLATYMGGMALGSWLGSRLYRRLPNGLLLYLLFEAVVGLYCLIAPGLLEGIRHVYVAIAAGVAPEASGLVGVRFALGSVLLLLPTVLMGASLPVLVGHLRERGIGSERSLAPLYAANTIGAAFGAFAAGYLIIPNLGLYRTTATAAMLSLFVAWLALRLLKTEARASGVEPRMLDLLKQAKALRQSSPEAAAPEFGPTAAPLLVLTLIGMVTMVVETNFIHLLAVVAGSSAYAFSLMLSTFLVGLAAGSTLIGRVGSAFAAPASAVGCLCASLALVLFLGGLQWDAMAGYFGNFDGYPLAREFGAYELIRAVVCIAVMFPPAFLIGAIYPVAMHWAAPDGHVRSIGQGAAFNTIGNIAGVFVGGFVLLPHVGAHAAVKAAALLSALLAAWLMLRLAGVKRAIGVAVASAGALVLIGTPWHLDMTAVANGANVYFSPLNYGPIIDHAESVEGGLSAVSRTTPKEGKPYLTLTTNGKFQGNDAPDGEMHAQLGFAVTPLLHTDAREHALVIGYGTGMSAHTLKESGFRRLDIADLSGDIVRLADKHFASINGLVSQAPGVKTHIIDGRNLLLLQDTSYDLIGIEISSIWFAGAASLYNKEFYELVNRRLRDGGVLQQWVQLHHMRPQDLLTVIGSIRAVFPQVWVYVVGGQGIIVAGKSAAVAPAQRHKDAIANAPSLNKMMKDLKVDVPTIESSRMLAPEDVDRMLSAFGVSMDYWVSNDDNLRLEYGTPRGNVLDGTASFDANMNILRTKTPVAPAR